MALGASSVSARSLQRGFWLVIAGSCFSCGSQRSASRPAAPVAADCFTAERLWEADRACTRAARTVVHIDKELLEAEYSAAEVPPGVAEKVRESLVPIDECIRLNPHASLGYLLRANAYWTIGDLDAAAVDYDRAVEISQAPELISARGALNIQRGRMDAARADVELLEQLGSPFARTLAAEVDDALSSSQNTPDANPPMATPALLLENKSLSPEDQKDRLEALNDLCPDAYCAGSFLIQFQALACDFEREECELGFRMTTSDALTQVDVGISVESEAQVDGNSYNATARVLQVVSSRECEDLLGTACAGIHASCSIYGVRSLQELDGRNWEQLNACIGALESRLLE